MTGNMQRTAEEQEIIASWLARPPGQRSGNDLEQLEQWILEHRPDLLPKGKDDAYEYLARLLAGLIEEG